MRITLVMAIIGLFLISAPTQAQKKKPVKSVASITTYTPRVGDKLEFDYWKGKAYRVKCEVASIASGTSPTAFAYRVSASAIYIPKQGQSRKAIFVWKAEKDFINKNFTSKKRPGLTTKLEVMKFGKFRMLTSKVSIDGSSFWFSVNSTGVSTFPGLIKAIHKGRVLVNLRSITRKKKK